MFALTLPAAAEPADHSSYSLATANFAGAGKPGEWTSQARDYANMRYSPLDQINAGNISRLKLAWSFSDGTQYGHEGGPLVNGDTMYVVTPFPNIAYARPQQTWSVGQVVVPAEPFADRYWQGLLRRCAARLGLCRGEADLQSARR